jgi:hypothetical protein
LGRSERALRAHVGRRTVSGFSADWLELRAPADSAARSAAIVETVGARRDHDTPLAIVDLGAGAGANLHYLAPKIGGAQQWLFVDDDPALLDAARRAVIDWAARIGAAVSFDERATLVTADTFACSIRTAELDLARDLAELSLPNGALVTASALLDLVSARWLERLADACREARARVLFALTYDGRITLRPGEPDDELACALFNRHQRGNKGFGPALGPDAADAALEIFTARGYALEQATSDWCLDAGERRLQAALIDGWLAAALEIAPAERSRLIRWHARHRERIDGGRSELVVGHRDVAGRLAA